MRQFCFVDVAIQPEVRFIAKQNSLMKIGNNGNLVLGPFESVVQASSPGESPRLVPNIRISVGAQYRHGIRAAESSIVESIPCHPK
ncbi:hypothetical protein TNCV_2734471 [Trichonephila clavipes]|nr:hypothetical protein TNCV_2734471 [Trichonephila clavipes]